MAAVENWSDAELRTKLLEFGFPVMPITGTTRKVMVKKLKLLLENKNKVDSSEGRRSLGKYSSEEESDTDVKITKNQKNRRITMAAPASSTSRTNKKITEPEPIIINSPKNQIRTTTSSTTSTTSRSSRIVKAAQDNFDTGSDSESDIVVSSNNLNSPNKYNNSSIKYDDDDTNAEESRENVSVKSGYSRYSPSKSDEYCTVRDFSTTSSPSRHTTYGDSILSGSLASDYAADRLNQMKSRLSVGPSFEKSVTYTPEVKISEKDTPFLSNFTRRLSALSAAKKPDYDYKNDSVKEQDTNNGLSSKSYLSNFRATRGRDATLGYKAKHGDGGKNSFVSYAVLIVVAAFFIILGVVYLGMMSDTALVTSGYIAPICDLNDPQSKKGVNCILKEYAENAINLLNSISPELIKRAVTSRCYDSTINPQMSESEIQNFCQTNYDIEDSNMIRNDLHALEVMIFSNPQWGIQIAQTENNNRPVTEEDIVKNMDELLVNYSKKITTLVMLNPTLPYRCIISNSIANALYSLTICAGIFLTLLILVYAFKFYFYYEQKEKNEITCMVEKIIEILQNNACNEQSESVGYVVINHVRDAILSVKERKAKQKLWEKAVKYINENESRVRTEVQSVHGESFDVWRWIGSANLSMNVSGNKDFKYRPGRRIIDVEYFTKQILQFPHRPLFFCSSSKDVFIKNEIREGFFSIFILRCARCLKEHAICSEEPKTELMDVNLAFCAGILSLRLDLYQLNELCNFLHLPRVSGKDFRRYVEEIHEISKQEEEEEKGSFKTSTPKKNDQSERFDSAFEEADLSLEIVDFEDKKKAFLKDLEKNIATIETLKLDQDSDLWFIERKRRLTASNFGRIVKLLDTTNRANLVKDLLYSQFKGNIYTQYGQKNESNAIKQFELITGKKVEKCGLVIHKLYAYLAATPDGIIPEDNAIIEIKCPYKARNSSSIEEAIQKKEIQFARFVEGKLKLNKEDKYYYQVQGQLQISGKNICYFAVWTPKDLAYEIIEKDDLYWEKMLPKLDKFYFEHLLPEILNKRN